MRDGSSFDSVPKGREFLHSKSKAAMEDCFGSYTGGSLTTIADGRRVPCLFGYLLMPYCGQSYEIATYYPLVFVEL